MSWQEQAESILHNLLELHCHKNALLEMMLDITSQRSRLDETEQTEKIMELIEIRLGYINNVDAIDAEIQKNFQSYLVIKGDNLSSANLPQEFNICWEKLKECKQAALEMVRKMQELDELQKESFERQFSSLKKQQGKIKTGWQTLNAYRMKSSSKDSVFIDKKE